MEKRFIKSEAIVIKRFNYKEADRVLTLFTKKYGKISVLAKAVRKPVSRKRGHVELFNFVQVEIVKGKGFDILTEVNAFNDFDLLRSDLEKVKSAFYICELVDKMLPENEKNLDLFELLLNSLKALDIPNSNIAVLENYFKHKIVRLLGFWPGDKRVPDDINVLIKSIVESPLGSVKGWEVK